MVYNERRSIGPASGPCVSAPVAEPLVANGSMTQRLAWSPAAATARD